MVRASTLADATWLSVPCDLWLGDASAVSPAGPGRMCSAVGCVVVVVLRFLRTRGLQACQSNISPLVFGGNVRAFDVQGCALFTRTALAHATFDLLTVAPRACLDVRRLFGRHHCRPARVVRPSTSTGPRLQKSRRCGERNANGSMVLSCRSPALLGAEICRMFPSGQDAESVACSGHSCRPSEVCT